MARGRKRKPGKREPNGKLSRRNDEKQARRSIDEQAVMAVAKEGRQRVHGVTVADSATELAGSVIGRLRLIGSISQEQYDAAKAIEQTYARYQRAMASPRPPKAVDIGIGSHGLSIPYDMTPDDCAEAIKRWDAVVARLSRANIEHRGATIYAAVDYIVLRDEDHQHLHGDLRLGLNALVRHFGLEGRRAA